MIKASDYIAQFFAGKGINVIFGYIGGMITHLVDSIDKNPNIQFIQTYHEQTAAMAAEGYALESGKPGVAIATSGPGATNLLTGIADAFFGSIPTIFITGQVNTFEYKNDKKIRQQGFQETDVVSLTRPITKYSVMIDNADNLVYELEKAYWICMEGRKGPVLIDLPMDISRALIDPKICNSFIPKDKFYPEINWFKIKNTIYNSKRPLLLLGGGCRDIKKEINNFIKCYKIPFVTSLIGKGIADESSEQYIGMIGSYGNRDANIILSQCDVLIALGSRLDTRQTGACYKDFLPDSKIVHVDLDKEELKENRLNNRIEVYTTVEQFLEGFKKNIPTIPISIDWEKWVKNIKYKYNQTKEVNRFVNNKAPYDFFKLFNKVILPDSIITVDVGQNQMWTAQTIKLKNNQHFFTSGGLAPMGFALPVAVGASFASPHKTVYCITGDGGFLMALQTLLLISQYSLNIKVIILNNEALGMITQFQQLYFNGNMPATTSNGGYQVPDFKDISKGFYLNYHKLDSNDLSYESLKNVFKDNNCLLEYKIAGLTSVSPKLEFNRPIYDMSPSLSSEEISQIKN